MNLWHWFRLISKHKSNRFSTDYVSGMITRDILKYYATVQPSCCGKTHSKFIYILFTKICSSINSFVIWLACFSLDKPPCAPLNFDLNVGCYRISTRVEICTDFCGLFEAASVLPAAVISSSIWTMLDFLEPPQKQPRRRLKRTKTSARNGGPLRQ